MSGWIVIVKTPEGTQTIPLEADTAALSEDGKAVEFWNFGTLIEAVEKLRPDLPRDQSVETVRKFIRALSRFAAGSFKADAVIGYYQSEGQEVE